MKKIFAPLIVLCIFTACQNKNTEKIEDAEIIEKEKSTEAIAAPTLAGCYMMIIEKDSAYMHLDDSATYLAGHLSYKRFEKDSNRGNVILKADNDKLKGWYSFYSEGKLSWREIIFKILGTSLAEAYGDIEMKGDSVNFKYPVALKFEDKHPFIKTECK